MSNTASIAASVISEMSGTPEPASVKSNLATNAVAAHRGDIAAAEIAHLMDHPGIDADNPTARIAAVNIARSDPRGWEITRQGNMRREHIPSGYGSDLSSRMAREVMDLQAANAGREVDPADRQALAIQRFVEDTPEADLPLGMRNATPGSPEWFKAANAAIDAIIRKGRGGNR